MRRKGAYEMKLSKEKYMIARARACVSPTDIIKAGMPKGTLGALTGGRNAKPETVGKLAKILGCDVTEIIED